MRFTPAAIALSSLALVTASVSYGAGRNADPRAQALVAQGQMQLEAGDTQGAIDAFEAALVIDPAYDDVYIDLGNAARQDGLQGKAIHYYREVLDRDPENVAAISGEGAALAEKGALENARNNLARLTQLCRDCAETAQLSAAITRGPVQRVMTAEAASPDSGVSAN